MTASDDPIQPLGSAAADPWKLSVYGPAVELDCQVLELREPVARFLDLFRVGALPGGAGAIRGTVRLYDPAEVVRRLPATARPLHRPEDLVEIYAENERFWVIDDRWGMCEINILRGQWRSWILPRPKHDLVRLAEAAVLWPLAQLLKNQGIHLLPAAAIAKDDFAALVLCPFGLEPELSALLDRGYGIIGQRWVVAREEEGEFLLLHVPGVVQQETTLRVRGSAQEPWTDLTAGRPESSRRYAFCKAVLVTEAGRRPRAHLRRAVPQDAVNLLRRAWPLPDLHPGRRQKQLPTQLAQAYPCFQLQLSRDPKDLLDLLEPLHRPTRQKQIA